MDTLLFLLLSCEIGLAGQCRIQSRFPPRASQFVEENAHPQFEAGRESSSLPGVG